MFWQEREREQEREEIERTNSNTMKLTPSKKQRASFYQELVDVHRRVDRDLPSKVVLKLVFAAAGRGRVAEELGEALI